MSKYWPTKQMLEDEIVKLKAKNKELQQGIINDRNDVVLVPKKIYDQFENHKAENKRLRDSTDWLLEEYHFLSRKMTEINNIVQPLWGELRERRNDYQLIEKFIEQIKKEGLEQALKGTP